MLQSDWQIWQDINSSQNFSNSTIQTTSQSIPGFHSQQFQRNDSNLPNFKPSGKFLKCVVVLADGKEEIFIIDSASLGHHLFNAVLEKLQLNERQYFGITYKDKNKNQEWLDYSMKISEQVPEEQMIFEFQVKFYPPEIGMIEAANTIIYLAQQIRQDLLCGKLQCSYYVYQTMASYIIQAEIGDYNGDIHEGIDYIKTIPVAPPKIQTQEFMEDLVELHKTQCGLSSIEAYQRFLINSTKFGLYGMNLHLMKDLDGEDVTLGVNYLGISIYYGWIKKFMFPWCLLVQCNFEENKLILFIKGYDENEPHKKHKFKFSSVKKAQLAYKSIVDNHFFFILTGFRTDYETFKYKQKQDFLHKIKKDFDKNLILLKSKFLLQRQEKINDFNHSTNSSLSEKIKKGSLSNSSINHSNFQSKLPKCSTLKTFNESKKDLKLSTLLEEESTQNISQNSANQTNFKQNKQEIKQTNNYSISHDNLLKDIALKNNSQSANNFNVSTLSIQSKKAAKLVNNVLQRSK